MTIQFQRYWEEFYNELNGNFDHLKDEPKVLASRLQQLQPYWNRNQYEVGEARPWGHNQKFRNKIDLRIKMERASKNGNGTSATADIMEKINYVITDGSHLDFENTSFQEKPTTRCNKFMCGKLENCKPTPCMHDEACFDVWMLTEGGAVGEDDPAVMNHIWAGHQQFCYSNVVSCDHVKQIAQMHHKKVWEFECTQDTFAKKQECPENHLPLLA
jgi:hypothetical protein